MFHVIKALIMHLLFAKAVCITCGHPVNLTNNWLEIVPEERLEFLDPSAKLIIDVSHQFNKEHGDYLDISDPYRHVIFPRGAISIILVFEDGEKFLMNDSERGIGIGRDSMDFNIRPARQTEKEINWENKKIVKMYMKSSKTIENVELTWVNSSK